MRAAFGVLWYRRIRRRSAIDRQLGVDTDRGVSLRLLDIKGPNLEGATAYHPCGGEHFAQAMAALDIRFADYAFIDIGCGKGRALLLAAKYGYRELIGVEFGRQLVETARKNLARAGIHGTVHWADALEFDYPAGPKVCYLYNPFGAEMISRVTSRLRECVLLYENAAHRESVDKRFHLVREGDGWAIYSDH